MLALHIIVGDDDVTILCVDLPGGEVSLNLCLGHKARLDRMVYYLTITDSGDFCHMLCVFFGECERQTRLELATLSLGS